MSFVECLEDTLHRQIYAYWQQKRGSRRMPSRTDIDPTEMPRLLPNLLISEYVAEGEAGRWRYRLAGTAVAAAFGRNPTGRYIDELTKGDYRAFIEHIHRTVREEQRALFCASEYTGTRDLRMSAKRLLLPLTKDGQHVDQIITLLVFRLGTGLPSVIELDRTEGTTEHAGPILADA
ncbi:MAG: PAS domain-containing protein [Stellaceae bacterium]